MDPIWHNCEIRFDCPASQLKLRKGEKTIDTISNIEDTKGNPDESGTFRFTNLRAIWYSDVNASINLSIGYDTLTGFDIKANHTASHGNTQELVLKCKYNTSKYEFIFTSRSSESNRMGHLFQSLQQAYESTKLYRDLRMRGAIIQDRDLILLPHEAIVNRYNNVWNLSSESNNVGTLVITNIRIVWYHSASDNFNASIPYIQIKSIKKKDSKSGPALVVETFSQPGENKGYTMGFQNEQLANMLQELQKLHKLYFQNPYFGVEEIINEKFAMKDSDKNSKMDDDIEVVESEFNERNHNIMSYMTSNAAGNEPDKEIVFSTELGLAIEKPPKGVTVGQLWKILNVPGPSSKKGGE